MPCSTPSACFGITAMCPATQPPTKRAISIETHRHTAAASPKVRASVTPSASATPARGKSSRSAFAGWDLRLPGSQASIGPGSSAQSISSTPPRWATGANGVVPRNRQLA